jgi:hypothetical protein
MKMEQQFMRFNPQIGNYAKLSTIPNRIHPIPATFNNKLLSGLF